MVLVNPSPNSVNADLHFVPSIHLPDTNRAAVKAAAATNAAATISKGTIVTNAPAPFRAAFSSQGPLLAGGGDILKPDIIAPGQDVLAAVAPPGNRNRLFDLYSGTSMSSPHMAGLGALMKQAHPDWSPAAIKSAFMTTAYQSNDYSAFGWGAGHVDPNKAVDPGLVFDNDFDDWLDVPRGSGSRYRPAATPLDASDLNLASIAIGDLAGTQTVKRAATSVGSQSETYSVSVQGLTGITVAPSANSFTAAPGSTTNWTVTFTRTTAPLGTYQTGFITWTGDKGHVVRMPVVIRPVSLAAPAEVTFDTLTGPSSWDVKTGYVGTLNASVRGLVPATATDYVVTQDPDANWISCGDTQGTFVRNTLFRPERRTPASVSTRTPSRPREPTWICSSARVRPLVGVSADGDSDEEVNFLSAARASRTLSHSPCTCTGSTRLGPSATGTLFEWAVGSASAGNTTLGITPAGPTTIGGTKTVTANFAGLCPTPGTWASCGTTTARAIIGSHRPPCEHAVGRHTQQR